MPTQEHRFANFVIGGTEKAGTTSVFDWLSQHPETCASSRKETDFFRKDFTGDLMVDAHRYASFFSRCNGASPIRVEASPGYLGEAALVAPRMQMLAPEMKVLFILRDPIERLYSSYHFHRGRLNLPAEMSFDDYVTRCLQFDRGAKAADELGLDEWYLKVLRFGCYADSIATFRSHLEPRNVRVMFFEALRDDPRAFMGELSAFLGIDAGFWRRFEFRRSNVTFYGRNQALHRLAVKANSTWEPLMRRFPRVKQSLVRAYKLVNQQREGYEPIPARSQAVLKDFYGPDVRALCSLVDSPLPESWTYLARAGAEA